MLLYVDTHCNWPCILKKLSFHSGKQKLSERFLDVHKRVLQEVPFEGCISVSSDVETQQDTLSLINDVDCIYGAFGMHPLYCKDYTVEFEKNIQRLMSHPKVVAYGEIGLDYHRFEPQHQYAAPELQRRHFITQMQHALQYSKPIIIHTREAEEETLRLMKEHIPQDWKIHVHCFTDSLRFSQSLIREFDHLFLGFTGVITFHNATGLREVVKETPLDRLLLETDGPFMAPVPFRGQVCHSGHIPFIASKIAEIKNVSLETVYESTRQNTKTMYGI